MMEVVEILVAVAIGVLAAVFLGSLAALALVCYRRALHAKHHLFYSQDIRPEVLMNSGELWSELELDDVRLAPQIDKILNDTQWVDDATGLIPHCLAILKLCHQMTERLVATTMTPIQKERLHDIIEAQWLRKLQVLLDYVSFGRLLAGDSVLGREVLLTRVFKLVLPVTAIGAVLLWTVTRRLSPRIDDVARAMYPPLDPRLLEARCSALILTLTLLAWHARYSTSNSTVTLINEALKDMDRHLTVLREAAMAHETFRGIFAEDVSCDAAE